MVICKRCIQGIESRGENLVKKKIDYTDNAEITHGYYDDVGNFINDDNYTEEYIYCEWCGQHELFDEMYVI